MGHEYPAHHIFPNFQNGVNAIATISIFPGFDSRDFRLRTSKGLGVIRRLEEDWVGDIISHFGYLISQLPKNGSDFDTIWIKKDITDYINLDMSVKPITDSNQFVECRLSFKLGDEALPVLKIIGEDSLSMFKHELEEFKKWFEAVLVFLNKKDEGKLINRTEVKYQDREVKLVRFSPRPNDSDIFMARARVNGVDQFNLTDLRQKQILSWSFDNFDYPDITKATMRSIELAGENPNQEVRIQFGLKPDNYVKSMYTPDNNIIKTKINIDEDLLASSFSFSSTDKTRPSF